MDEIPRAFRRLAVSSMRRAPPWPRRRRNGWPWKSAGRRWKPDVSGGFSLSCGYLLALKSLVYPGEFPRLLTIYSQIFDSPRGARPNRALAGIRVREHG